MLFEDRERSGLIAALQLGHWVPTDVSPPRIVASVGRGALHGSGKTDRETCVALDEIDVRSTDVGNADSHLQNMAYARQDVPLSARFGRRSWLEGPAPYELSVGPDPTDEHRYCSDEAR